MDEDTIRLLDSRLSVFYPLISLFGRPLSLLDKLTATRNRVRRITQIGSLS
jgi:hypothetical protein